MEPFGNAGEMYTHGMTFGGHPVQAAVALKNIEIMKRERIVEHVREHEADFRAALEPLLELPIVGDVRGCGFFYAIELVKDKETRESFCDEECNELLRGFVSPQLFERGLICRADDRGDPVVQISPAARGRAGGVRLHRLHPRRGARGGRHRPSTRLSRRRGAQRPGLRGLPGARRPATCACSSAATSLGGACVTEEVWPGQRVSRASYVVSMLQPKVVRDLELERFGYEAIPLDPAFAHRRGGRPADLLLQRRRANASVDRAPLAQGRRRLPGLRGAAREDGRLPAPADAAPAAGRRLQAARRPALAAARGRPRGGAEEARHARAVSRDDDVGRRPARRLVRERRDQGRLRVHRRGRRLGRAAHARHRLQPAPPRARRAERRERAVGAREGRDGRHLTGAGTQRRGGGSDDPHRRRSALDRRRATAAPPASRSTRARRSARRSWSRAPTRAPRSWSWPAPSTSRTRW